MGCTPMALGASLAHAASISQRSAVSTKNIPSARWPAPARRAPAPCGAAAVGARDPRAGTRGLLRCSATPPQTQSADSRGECRRSARPGERGGSTVALEPVLQAKRWEGRVDQDTASATSVVPVGNWTPTPEVLMGCEPNSPPLKVAMLLSGGVDSSVALRLLLAAGHQCTAFYLQIWVQEDFRNFWGECPWEEDLKYAQGVCDQAGVELKVVPLTKEYWDRVVSHTIKEIERGRTPNPDILCNSRVKFGAFYDYLSENHVNAFDRIASGHYARLERPKTGPSRLTLSSDQRKDQTYFLAHLSQAQLARVMFPIGYLSKPEVRLVAESLQLMNCSRKDSQGICFLGKVEFREFVKAHLGEREGPLVEFETGDELGRHKGFWFHTIGQRQGLGLSNGPWYVHSKDTEANVVYVSKNYHLMETKRDRFLCAEFNWTLGEQPAASALTRCKLRHGAHIYQCVVEFADDGCSAATVSIDGDDQGIAAGQYSVFYDDEGCCVGSGVIQHTLPGSPKEVAPQPEPAVAKQPRRRKRTPPRHELAAKGGAAGAAARANDGAQNLFVRIFAAIVTFFKAVVAKVLAALGIQ